MLFAYDQVVLAKSEDDLQRNVHKLEKIIKVFDMNISAQQKTKTVTFRGREPVWSKIVINGNIIEQVKCFKYLGVDISYEREVDFQRKIYKFLKITGLINRTLTKHQQNEMQYTNKSPQLTDSADVGLWVGNLGVAKSRQKTHRSSGNALHEANSGSHPQR